jgi:hypothetical protein
VGEETVLQQAIRRAKGRKSGNDARGSTENLHDGIARAFSRKHFRKPSCATYRGW